jgi:elongator complex protein 1
VADKQDPKEYLPFLRELRALDQHEQRFRIDDHLGKRESALRNLVAGGDDRFDDATSYLSRYELYDEAFELYADQPESLIVRIIMFNSCKLISQIVHDLYGDYLYDRREFYNAAICTSELSTRWLTIAYTMAQYPAKAMKAYEKAHAWRELFTLAKEQGLDADTIAAMVERVTGKFSVLYFVQN